MFVFNFEEKREQPLVLITTTAGTIRNDIYDYIYDDAKNAINGLFDDNDFKDECSLYGIYKLDKREERTNQNYWEKANPGLEKIKL